MKYVYGRIFTYFCQALKQHGQDLNKWIAATFSGRTIAINDQHVTPVTAEDVSKYDAWLTCDIGGAFFGARDDVFSY